MGLLTVRARAAATFAFAFIAIGCATKGVDGSTHFVICHSDSECAPEQTCSVDQHCVSRTTTDAGVTNACTSIKEPTNLLEAPLPGGSTFDSLVADGPNLYFTGGDSIYRVPVSGGVAESLYSGPLLGLLGSPFAAKNGVVAWVPATADNVTPAGLSVSNTDGVQSVVFPSGVLPADSPMVVDTDGNVIFNVSLPGARWQTWKWSPTTNSATEMPGVDAPDASSVINNLYWADRGQLVWASSGGVYITEISTGETRRVLDHQTDAAFGGLLGLDASNLYGASGICPGSCKFTVSAVPRGGGTPVVVYETADAYWTASLPHVDSSGLYWIDWTTRAIYHAPLTLGAPAKQVVSVAPSGPGGTIPARFAVDACNVYWFTSDQSGETRLMAAPK